MYDNKQILLYTIIIAACMIFSFLHPIFSFMGIGILIIYYFKLNGFLITFEDKIKIKLSDDITKQKEAAEAYCNEIETNATNQAAAIISSAQATYKSLVETANNKLSSAEEVYDSTIANAQIKSNEIILSIQDKKNRIQEEILALEPKQSELNELLGQLEKTNKSYENQKKKLADAKKLCKNALEVINTYFRDSIPDDNIRALNKVIADIDQLDPTVTIKANALDYPDLRKEFNRNQKLIKDITEKYTSRYTLKTYAAIYKLMVLALSAELQNIIYSLKYDKLDVALNALNNMFDKYITIATEGNQTISPTLLSFIGEIKGLYISAIKIEYEYYVKKERAKEEQAALREQMRQEAEERRILEEQKKQVLKEESKYQTEIKNINSQLTTTEDSEQVRLLKNRLAELEKQLKEVNDKKEEIITLQNGKAGYVYVISNLGSFGDKMFKVGMTRRLDPQDRVNELGDASVPFKFDVHSFIFSEDASALETKLHHRLEKQRVNKVNNRKEFFYSTIDELERLVNEVEPTAEFNRTMLAEQYRQSLTLAEDFNE